MWFITTIEKVEYYENENDIPAFPDFGDQRTWGYYSDREKAVQALHKNLTDMYEYLYDYALIEKFEEGICPYASPNNRQWFKWDSERKGYYEIEEPEVAKHVVNFAIG